MTTATAILPTFAPDRAAYAEAVTTLLDLVDRHPGTGDARAAAEVLLACYNGYDFHLAPHVVRGFNEERHRDAALTVIVQGGLGYADPHEVIADGDRRFRALWDEYKQDLHVEHRYADWYR